MYLENFNIIYDYLIYIILSIYNLFIVLYTQTPKANLLE